MLNEKVFRQIADRKKVAAGKSLDSKERLVLLRCQASLCCGRLTKCLKLSYFVSELSERFVVDPGGWMSTAWASLFHFMFAVCRLSSGL